MLRIDAAPVVVLEQPFRTFVLETLDHYRGHPASRAGVKAQFYLRQISFDILTDRLD
jgi:hypothetical protein